MENQLIIDPEAKGKVSLVKVPKDAVGNPYFIGKLQFPAVMEFDRGVSFMVFLAEDGFEEIQIAPLDPTRRNKTNRDGGASINNGRFSISLYPRKDQNGSIYYIGEAIGLFKIDLSVGVFFTVFTSVTGQEQIQISKLQHKTRPKEDGFISRMNSANNTFDPRRFSEV